MKSNHILEGTRHKEKLLRESQSFPGVGLVVWIKHFRNGFRSHFLVHGAIVIAEIERLEIKGFDRLRFPEPEQVCRGGAITWHRSIVRNSLDDPRRQPAH